MNSTATDRKIKIIPPKANMNTEKKKKVKKTMLPPTAESVQHRKTRKPAMRHRWHTSQN